MVAPGAEEGQVVDDPVVETFYFAGIDDVNGFLCFQGQTEVPCQSVARTAGDDAESRVRMYQ